MTKILCDVGNTYGSLVIKEEHGKFYWAVEDYDDSLIWQEIAEETYNAIKKEVL
ncbi:hypothetical protein [Yersinia phage fHe-Yen9-04]|uniref:Uncharacterized protein n=1 Tax=Yersinia phage fHe-Yen9-04 TaxID=2052742 RepID=A0A2C9CY47_9CAUD|nr:hypothetical protein FDJ41_gp403 [Yersinia phage fHe-Yen9-04]SOK58777.1 hypothetical protein [Yersinia phage fHe-Yen9-04]VUE36546.1 hypothetical protein [Yersinia phage fHe-Yen9-04]